MERFGIDVKQKVEGINVVLRLRPPRKRVEEQDSSQVLKVSPGGKYVSVCNTEQPTKAVSYAFDQVFGPDAIQQDVFRGLLPALDTILQGFNACILAYGQTGSGKTHTLIGPDGGTKLAENSSDWGIIPRAVQFLFDRLLVASEEDETFTYSVTCSFMQIYNENLIDLLQDDGGRRGPSLQIREESGGNVGGSTRERRRRRSIGAAEFGSETEGKTVRSVRRASLRSIGLHKNHRVFVSGLSSFRVSGAEDVLRYVSLGAANRRVRATQHNEASSRSHAVMQLMVDSESGGGGRENGVSANGRVNEGHVTYRQAKLSIVDLAGSEKMVNAPTISGGYFGELRSINQSLSTLGNVVSALSEKGRKHVPYRDSKLTRLLQDSLGGNTRTTIIACVNPLAENANETISTLMFAGRAKKVMVRIRPNEVVDDRVLLARARAEITRLKQLLRETLDNALQLEEQSDSSTALGSRGHLDSMLSLDTDGMARAGAGTDEEVATTDYPNERAQIAKSAIQNRQVVKLTAENERLRDDNTCLLAKVQRMMQMKQRMKRRRRGGHSVTPVRRIAPPIPAAPIDWSARYANAASQARRRRLSSFREQCSSPRQLLPQARSSTLTPFKRREFETGDDDIVEGRPIEDDISEGEIRGVIGDYHTTTSTGNREEEEEIAQLGKLRYSLKAADRRNRMGDNSSVASRRAASDEIEKIVEESQRMEDLLFEAQGRERRRLREERERLSSSRAERLALEAQLAELTHGITHTQAVAPMPEIANAGIPGVTPTPADHAEQAVLASDNPALSDGGLPMMTARYMELGTEESSRNRVKSCWVETTDPMVATVKTTPLGRDSAENPTTPSNRELQIAVPVPKLTGRRRQTSCSPPTLFRRNQDGQRPATSAGAAGRARSRRVRHWGSRSPTKHRTSTLPVAPARRQGEKRSQKPTSLSAASTARLKVLQAKYPSVSSSWSLPSSPWEKGLLSGQPGRCLANSDAENGAKATTTTRLAFSAADLGLRLKIYSFRYDHHYDCQVIGYDSRRRMHRCAYDATAEKQWHDLAKKQFKVVGQNSVIIRSSESAPS